MTDRPNCPKCGLPMQRGNGRPKKWMCRPGRVYCYSTSQENPTAAIKADGTHVVPTKQPIFERELGGVTRFLITAAQNATPVHLDALESMKQYAKLNNAELLVTRYRYKNPTSVFPESQKGEDIWADEIQEFLVPNRIRIHPQLMLLADIKVQPTAISPLTGIEALTHGESGILGHPKLQFKTVATPQNALPKIMTTTGAITGGNYTDTLAGKRGAFHHTIGATLVELKGKKFHIRQINCEKSNGNFIDLVTRYTPAGAIPAGRPKALVLGDVHTWFADAAATRAADEQAAFLNPEYEVVHDLSDGYVFNPHHKDNPFIAVAKIKSGYCDARAEVEEALQWAARRATADRIVVIVPSNHNDFLQRAMEKVDWRTQPGNAEFMLETQLALVRAAKIGLGGYEGLDAFTYWARELLAKWGVNNVRVLDRDESFMLGSVENGMHGDVGPSGARGSIKNLRRIGVKSNIGHRHGPGIDEGCAQAGTLTPLRLEYNRGPGDWLNTNIVQYENDKRSLLNSINGEWRA